MELDLIKPNGQVAIQQAKAVAEVHGAILVARQSPRDESRALTRITQACQRPSLAEAAVYAYPRGGQEVTGPSIRLAETLARCWGNIQCGVRELSTGSDATEMEAFAHDLESNYRVTRSFTVRHERKAGGHLKALTDPRDLLELTANQGARRLRSCILAVIPADVIEDALKECARTLEYHTGTDDQSVNDMLAAFLAFQVTAPQIEIYLDKSLKAINAQDIARLKRIYTSIRDGMTTADQVFTAGGRPSKPSQADALNRALNDKETGETG